MNFTVVTLGFGSGDNVTEQSFDVETSSSPKEFEAAKAQLRLTLIDQALKIADRAWVVSYDHKTV